MRFCSTNGVGRDRVGWGRGGGVFGFGCVVESGEGEGVGGCFCVGFWDLMLLACFGDAFFMLRGCIFGGGW